MAKQIRKSSGIIGKYNQVLHFDDETEKPKILVWLGLDADATKHEIEESICAHAGVARAPKVAVVAVVADATDAFAKLRTEIDEMLVAAMHGTRIKKPLDELTASREIYALAVANKWPENVLAVVREKLPRLNVQTTPVFSFKK